MNKDFAGFILAIHEYYGKEIENEGIIDFWHNDLKKYDMQELKKAFNDYRQSEEGKFCPRTGNLISICENNRRNPANSRLLNVCVAGYFEDIEKALQDGVDERGLELAMSHLKSAYNNAYVKGEDIFIKEYADKMNLIESKRKLISGERKEICTDYS